MADILPKESKPKIEAKPKASWTVDDNMVLVTTLTDQAAMGNQAESGWKPVVWSAVVEALADAGRPMKGAVKEKDHVVQRWQKLKIEYKTVKTLLEQSGFGIDPDTGVITAPDSVWAAYIQAHPKAKIYQYTPFPLYSHLQPLCDPVIANGNGAFRAGRLKKEDVPQVVQAISSSDSLGDDDDKSAHKRAACTVKKELARASKKLKKKGPATASQFLRPSTTAPSTAPSSPSPVSQKIKRHFPSPTSSHTSKAKRPRVAGAATLGLVADSIDSLSTAILTSEGVDAPLTSPQCRRRAIEILEADSELEDEAVAEGIEVFESIVAVDSFLAIKRPAVRKIWLRKKMNSK